MNLCFEGIIGRIVHFIMRLLFKDKTILNKLVMNHPWLEKWGIIGEIDGRTITDPVVLKNRAFGKSSFFPSVLEIVIDKENSLPDNIGKKTDAIFFVDYPKMVFNVCFSCARSRPCGRGRYADPTSIWFNVFMGYYSINVPAKLWPRPFGYTSAEGARSFNIADVLKIVKSDWNYFSNYM